MKKTNLLTAFNLTWITVLTGYLTRLMPLGFDFYNLLLSGMIFSGIFSFFLVLLNGTLLDQKKFFYPLLGFILLIFVGFIFRVLHWKYQGELMLLGITGSAVVYFVHFLLKENREILDYLKGGFVLFVVMRILFYIRNWPYSDYVSWVPVVLFWTMVIVFFFQKIRKIEAEDLLE